MQLSHKKKPPRRQEHLGADVSRLRLGIAFAFLLLAAAPGVVRADELAQLNRLILRDPTNVELNLRYASAAEKAGELKWALAAYERLIVNDPTNEEAREGLLRVRRKLQPNQTQIFTELGTAWESNPRYVPTGARGEWEVFGRAHIRDERALGDMRWRSTATFVGEAHRDNHDLNYGYGNVMTGPIIDLAGGKIAVNPALGVGGAVLQSRSYFGEVLGTLTFEGYMEGAYQTVRVRAAFRDYNDFFPSTQGFYYDIIGKFARPNVIAPGDVVVFTPYARLSRIGGTGITVLFDDVQAGSYFEYGASLGYYRRVLEWLTLGADFLAYQRRYAEAVNLLPPNNITRRRDNLVAPGAVVILHNLIVYQHDFRFDYHWQHNDSTDPTRPYINHLFTAASVARF
jgi:tetratricopeptide (TPR) repeat protein